MGFVFSSFQSSAARQEQEVLVEISKTLNGEPLRQEEEAKTPKNTVK